MKREVRVCSTSFFSGTLQASEELSLMSTHMRRSNARTGNPPDFPIAAVLIAAANCKLNSACGLITVTLPDMSNRLNSTSLFALMFRFEISEIF